MHGSQVERLIQIINSGIGSGGAETDSLHQSWRAACRRDTVARPALFVGTGTCGLGAGAAKTLAAVRAFLAARGLEADIVEVGCIGLCAEEPMLDLQLPGRTRLSFKEVAADRVERLLAQALAGEPPLDMVVAQFRSPVLTPWAGVRFMDEHPFFAPQKRWVLANCGVLDPTSIEEYVAHGGYQALAKTLRAYTRQEVCDLVERSGLRGRGGGGFQTGTKWKYALRAESEQKYLICNADEGDPGAFMDRAVIEGDPHRLVEGMAIAAYAIGASQAYVYIRAEYPLAIRRLVHALDQARACGLIGESILDSGVNLEVKIKQGAGAFVCGEETALIHSIEGRRGMPRPRPPFPAVRGLFGRPTVINNVETLANLPAILSHGAEWFSA
ncbi:MAG TPA: NADH-quinone oxidoreductase subunit F, partial [Candidatus Methylomirabilis sp.]|nr:NADH-quinone oxidoreductase subunit F [Candidatus Methylomirabilis sp.]